MATNPLLEKYLTQLDHALTPLSVSERADIVTEIKSHVLSALERDPAQPMDTLLAALGEPETVANRYLMERGQQVVKPPISPIIKWLVIGFLGTLAMLLLFAGLMLWKVSSSIHVDAKNQRVSLFGGLIEADGKKGTIRIAENEVGQGDISFGSDHHEGSRPVQSGARIDIHFNNGKVTVGNSKSLALEWNCETKRGAVFPEPTGTASAMSLNLTSLNGIKCDLNVPEGTQVALKGTNGKLELEHPRFSIEAELANGKVEINPEKDRPYRYELAVRNGKVDEFKNSSEPNAARISVKLGNGVISHE